MEYKKEVNGKPIKGLGYCIGRTKWLWGEQEVAIIDEYRREIEWCRRTTSLPDEVVEEIRKRMPNNPGTWIIEARRTQSSATQGNVSIFVNGVDMNMHFEDKMMLNENGDYVSTTPDEELGKFVYAALWHPLDYAYHYSDNFKDMFKPDWRK